MPMKVQIGTIPSLKIKIGKEQIAAFVIALFISSSVIRGLLNNYIEHAATVTLIILYGFLILSLIMIKPGAKRFFLSLIPIAVLWVLIFATWIFFPERHFFYQDSLYNLLDVGFPIYGAYITSICLLLVSSTDILIRSFKASGYIMTACCFIQALGVIRTGIWTRESIYNGIVVTVQSNYNLNWGYNVYLVCVIFFASFLLERKKRYLFYTGIGLVGILLYGSRGPIIMFALFGVLAMILQEKKRIQKRTFVVLGIGILLLILIGSGEIQKLILSIAEQFGSGSRTLAKFLSGDILDMSNRDKIYAFIIEKIKQNPFWGWGIYGDRYFLNLFVQGGSAYSHNILLELCMCFGVFGFAFFVWFVYRCVHCLRASTEKENRILLLIGIGGCFSLLLSLTFWNHPVFWVLLAVLIMSYRTKKGTAIQHGNEQSQVIC